MAATTEPDPIAAAVDAERRRRGMTQGELAALSGVRQPKISAWLSGREYARSDTVERILKALGGRVTFRPPPRPRRP